MSLPTTQCPVCGGGVHPIAGRCKHCKADLVAIREQQRQQAVAQALAAATPQPVLRAAGSTPNTAPAAAAPRAGTQPRPDSAPVVAHAPAVMYQRPVSGWSRRWPYLVAAVAVAAILASVVVMVQRWTADGDGTGASSQEGVQNPVAAPADPDTSSPPPTDPTAPPSTTPPNTTPPNASRPAPKIGKHTKTPEPGRFAVALTERVCAKLNSCGLLTSFSQMMCSDLAGQLGDPDAADKVKRGECRYDRASAGACLSAIDDLSCTAQSTDVMAWVTKAGALAECTNAYVCN